MIRKSFLRKIALTRIAIITLEFQRLLRFVNITYRSEWYFLFTAWVRAGDVNSAKNYSSPIILLLCLVMQKIKKKKKIRMCTRVLIGVHTVPWQVGVVASSVPSGQWLTLSHTRSLEMHCDMVWHLNSLQLWTGTVIEKGHVFNVDLSDFVIGTRNN